MASSTAPAAIYSIAKAKPLMFRSSRRGAFGVRREQDRIHAKLTNVDSVSPRVTAKPQPEKATVKPFGLFGAVSAMRDHLNANEKSRN